MKCVEVNIASYVEFEDQLVICQEMTVEEIIQTHNNDDENDSENDDGESSNISAPFPKISAVLQSVSTLQVFFSSQNESSFDFSSLYSIENAILHNASLMNCRQTTIDAFLSKEVE